MTSEDSQEYRPKYGKDGGQKSPETYLDTYTDISQI